MSEPCRFFKFIGSPVCDGCGREKDEHEGIQVLRGRKWLDLTWGEHHEWLREDEKVRDARKTECICAAPEPTKPEGGEE